MSLRKMTDDYVVGDGAGRFRGRDEAVRVGSHAEDRAFWPPEARLLQKQRAFLQPKPPGEDS